MKILDRYICREILSTSLIILLVLLLILSGNALLKIMADVVSGELPKDLIFPLLSVTILKQTSELISLSFFLGVIVSMGRLYQHSEMAAINVTGIGHTKMYKRVAWVIVPLALVLLCMSVFIAPWASEYREIIWKDAKQRAEINSISPGQFNSDKDNEVTLFFDKYDENTSSAKQTLLSLFIEFSRDEQKVVQTASSASKHVDVDNGNVYMLYKDGQFQSTNDDGFSIISFDEHAMLLREKVYPTFNSRKLASKSTASLFGSDSLQLIAELQMRFAVPLGAILLILLAVPMSYTVPRKGRYSRLGFSIVIYFLYTYILNLASSWVQSGKLTVIPGVFLVHIIIMFILLFILSKHERWFSSFKAKAASA